MMSYLWILLFGSLLAASAKAQDDVALAEEVAAPDTPAPDTNAAPEVIEELAADEETHNTDKEIPIAVSEPEPTADPEAEEPVTPADGDAELVTPADGDADGDAELVTPADGDAELVTPADGDADGDAELVTPADGDADGDAELVTPAVGDAELVTPAVEDAELATLADGDAELVTPADGVVDGDADGNAELVFPTAAADTEAEAAAITKEPAAGPEVENPKAEQPTANGEEEPTSSTDAAPAQESGATYPAAIDSEEEPTDLAADTDLLEGPGIDLEPTIKAGVAGKVNADAEFNLEDALGEGTAVHNQAPPGKSRSFEPGAQAAGATGNDKPEARESSSGSLAGIVSAVAVAVVGAVVGYFTYQKKKLCFKNRQEADPEAARKADAAEAQSDPQVLSNLLNSS